MDNITTTICVNGELKPGDLVLSTPDDYACLVGTVLSINKFGTPEHDAETENDTDSVHVNFIDAEYSERRIVEIEEMFSELYGEPKPFGECPIDDTIMSPDALIRITGIGEDTLRAILDSREAAEALCELVENRPEAVRDTRLGLDAPERETPAQAALHEPDIYDDEATAALREQLIARIDANLLSYFDDIRGNDELSITGISSEIAAVTGAHYYLSEIHNFHTSELEYLLQFQDPLEVVADAFQAAGMDDYSDIMWEIFDRQDALEGDYPLMGDTPVEPTQQQKLFEWLGGSLDYNLDYYHKQMADPNINRDELVETARKIVAHYNAHEYLTNGYEYRDGDIECLQKLPNPLGAVADEWPVGTAFVVVMDAVDSENSREQKAVSAAAAMTSGRKEIARDTGAEKESVLARIREAEKAPKEPHKGKPAKDKSGPEL